MRYNVLTAALIATIALCMTGCVSTRSVMSDVRWKMSDVRSDTVREQVVVTVFDTITITKTITVVLRQAQEPNEPDDTLRVTQITDKTKATTRDRYHDVQEKVVVRTDTVYIERDSLVVKNTNCTNPTNGSKRSRGSIVQGLKWFFFVLLAIIALILLIRLTAKR